MSARVTIYSRAGCHLCEQMKAAIEPARKRLAFTLEEVDIDSDPELVRRYGESIPVLAIEGRVAFKGKLTPEAFLEKFERIVAQGREGGTHA